MFTARYGMNVYIIQVNFRLCRFVGCRKDTRVHNKLEFIL